MVRFLFSLIVSIGVFFLAITSVKAFESLYLATNDSSDSSTSSHSSLSMVLERIPLSRDEALELRPIRHKEQSVPLSLSDKILYEVKWFDELDVGDKKYKVNKKNKIKINDFYANIFEASIRKSKEEDLSYVICKKKKNKLIFMYKNNEKVFELTTHQATIKNWLRCCF